MLTIRTKTNLLFIIISILITSSTVLIHPVKAAEFKTEPIHKPSGKWRIGYYEGGPYFNYQRNLIAFIKGLMELGWVEKTDLPEIHDPNDSSELWNFAANKLNSDYVEFVQSAYWSSNWDNSTRAINREDCIDRLQNKDIDFMIAAGTWAGQDLATKRHTVPLTVFAVSNAVKSGIIKSEHDSGLPNVHAKCDPDRYVRMARLFYNLFHFNKLGITYEDTEDGRIHAAVREIEQVAQKFDFELIRCIAPFHESSIEESRKKVEQCQEYIAQRADAAVIPVHRGVTTENMSEILAPYFEHKIPTFSQQGSLEVKHGVLMGITLGEEAFRLIGLFHAKTAASAFHGINVGELPLVFEDPRGVAINLETARRIGYTVPPTLELVSEDTYDTIAPDTHD